MKWKFETIDKSFSFEIEADDYSQAYDLAYECYGPQVEYMMYYQLKS